MDGQNEGQKDGQMAMQFHRFKKLAEFNHFKFLQMIFKNINPTRPDKRKIQDFFFKSLLQRKLQKCFLSYIILHYSII